MHPFEGTERGEGCENRPRSRHCNRLKSRKSGYPFVPRNAAFFARKSAVSSPTAARVGLFRWRLAGISSERILPRQSMRKRRRFVRRVPVVESGLRMAACVACIAAALLCNSTALRAQSSSQQPQGATSPSTRASETSEMREVTDEIGRTIRVPKSIHRVVSLAPSITETMYALGLQDLLVGDTEYCDFPPDARIKPKVGGAINPSLEAIAALHPDVVLVIKSLNRLDTVRALAEIGIPSYSTDPHTIADILASTRRLADLLGASESGIAVTRELEQRLESTRHRVAGSPPRRVLFVVWPQPLISIGRQTFLADALVYAGATSIVDSEQEWPQLSLEDVVHRQPEYLIFAESHSSGAPTELDSLLALPGWRIMDAAKNHRVALVSDAINRPAPRIVSVIEDLARQLHPEAFRDSQEAPREKPSAPAGSSAELWPASPLDSDLFAGRDLGKEYLLQSCIEESACSL
jgi:iron complex transport system substrate-binding protein